VIPVPAPFGRAPLLRRMWQGCAGLLAACLLALLVGAVLVRTRQPPAPILPAPSTLSAIRLELPANPEGSRTGQFVARPLFWAGRAPPPDETEAPPAKAPKAPELLDEAILSGLFTSGGASGAILNVGGQSQRLLVGQDLGSWTLESILGDEAVFTGKDGAGGQRRLTLEHAEVRRPRHQVAHPDKAGPEVDSGQKEKGDKK